MKFLIRAGVLIALSLTARPSSADIVDLNFTGTIARDTTGDFPAGTPFSGELTYDSTYNQMGIGGFDFGGSTFQHAITLTVGTFSYSTQGSSFRVSPGGTPSM